VPSIHIQTLLSMSQADP